MFIGELEENRVLPFEIDGDKLKKLFSFFLHMAPTVDSRMALPVLDEKLLEDRWNEFIEKYSDERYIFLSANSSKEKVENSILGYGLASTCVINRKTVGFVCKRKNNKEKDYTCLLRHLRNSIAHCNVCLIKTGNRNFILFDDFNQDKNTHTARILLSQTDLKNLKDKLHRGF